MRKYLLLLIGLLFFIQGADGQGIKPGFLGTVFVKKGGAGTKQGNSWANAVGELADALKFAYENNKVSTNTKVTQIWVAGGVYTPKYSPEEGAKFGTDQQRDNAFLLVKGVKVYGGFAGNESLDDRDLSMTENKSVLSGDFDGDDNVTRGGFR